MTIIPINSKSPLSGRRTSGRERFRVFVSRFEQILRTAYTLVCSGCKAATSGRDLVLAEGRNRVRAKSGNRGSGFRIEENPHKAATVGRAKSIANCKLKRLGSWHITADGGCWAARDWQFTARSQDNFRETTSGFTQNSSFILHPSSFPLHPPRPAFTLIEVMLTLCILVIMSAIAWPQLEKTFSHQRLRKAADIVRTQWCKARVEAMRTASMRVFRYEIEGNKYRIDMLSTDPAALLTGSTVDPAFREDTQLILADNTRPSQNAGNLNGATGGSDQMLPKDVFFVSGQTGLDTLAATGINNSPVSANASPADPSVAGNIPSVGAGWSEPIFFYPDGTTSNAQLLLRNKEGQMIRLFLRGLTGIVKVGDVAAGGQIY